MAYDKITYDTFKKYGKKDSPGYAFLLGVEELEADIEKKRRSGMFKEEYLKKAKENGIRELEAAHREVLKSQKEKAEKALNDLRNKYEDKEDPIKALLSFERKKLKVRAKSVKQLLAENDAYIGSSEKRDVDELLLLSTELRNRGETDKADDLLQYMETKKNTENWHLDPKADELIEKYSRVSKPLSFGHIRFTLDDKDKFGDPADYDEDWEIGKFVKDA